MISLSEPICSSLTYFKILRSMRRNWTAIAPYSESTCFAHSSLVRFLNEIWTKYRLENSHEWRKTSYLSFALISIVAKAFIHPSPISRQTTARRQPPMYSAIPLQIHRKHPTVRPSVHPAPFGPLRLYFCPCPRTPLHVNGSVEIWNTISISSTRLQTDAGIAISKSPPAKLQYLLFG